MSTENKQVVMTIRHDLLSWVNPQGIPSGIWDDLSVDLAGGVIEGSYNYRDWTLLNLPVFGEPASEHQRARRRPDNSNRELNDHPNNLKFWVRGDMLMFQTFFTFSGNAVDKFEAIAVLTPDEFMIFGTPKFSLWDMYAAEVHGEQFNKMSIGELRQACPLLHRDNVYIAENGELSFARLFTSSRRVNTATLELPPVHLGKAGQVMLRRIKRSMPIRSSAYEQSVFACRAFEVQTILDEISTKVGTEVDFGDVLHRAKHTKMTRLLSHLHSRVRDELELITPTTVFDDGVITALLVEYNMEAAAVVRSNILNYLKNRTARELPFLSKIPKDWFEVKEIAEAS